MSDSLSISFQNKQLSGSSDCLTLEQKEWGSNKDLGFDDIVAYFLNRFYSKELEELDCGLEEDEEGNLFFITPIYVSLKNSDIGYSLYTSHGTLGELEIQEKEYTEVTGVDLQLMKEGSLDLSIDTKYLVTEVINAVWEGDVFDSVGNVTSAPVLNIVNEQLFTSFAVYGAVKLTYKALLHKYLLTVPKRLDAVEHEFDSFVYAISDCGIDFIEIKPLPLDEEECIYSYGGGGVTITGPDDEPTDGNSDAHVVWSYCWPHDFISASPPQLEPGYYDEEEDE